MKTSIKTLDFQGVGIQFTADGWINATLTAQLLGKERLDHFMASPTFLEYAQVVADSNSLNSGDLKVARRGRYGSGTFLHPELAVAFARWISPGFAYWCDKQVPVLVHQAQERMKLSESTRTKRMKKLGRPTEAIAARNEGVSTRLFFASTLKKHGVRAQGFGDCTRAIYMPFFGGGTAHIKEKLGLPQKANVRDHMSHTQLAALSLSEAVAAERIEKEGGYGNLACVHTCNQVGQTIARSIIEARRPTLAA